MYLSAVSLPAADAELGETVVSALLVEYRYPLSAAAAFGIVLATRDSPAGRSAGWR